MPTLMNRTILCSFLLVSSAFLSLPAQAQTDSTTPNLTVAQTDANAPKTRAEVKAELAQAQRNGDLNPVTHSTYPSLRPYEKQ